MKISITPKYIPKTEKPYCCIPAVLQMIQERRGLDFASQDEIGYQLGLIVPKEKAHFLVKYEQVGCRRLAGERKPVKSSTPSITNSPSTIFI